jgi:predicted component of type VI protein secretion system
MMRQSLKVSGLSEDQIDAMIKIQETALRDFDPEAICGQMKTFAAAVGKPDLSVVLEGDGSCFEFVERPSINKAYQWAVACGADLIHLKAGVINDLSTWTARDTSRIILADRWSIKTEADFTQLAERLKAGSHSRVYAQLAGGKAVKDFDEEAENLSAAREVFERDKLIGARLPNMLSWDLGRLVNVSRLAFDAGFLSREAALEYLKDAALQVKKEYASWKELSIGYQFGRAVWGGLAQYEELKEGMEQLLTEEDSPWVRLPFDMELDFDG